MKESLRQTKKKIEITECRKPLLTVGLLLIEKDEEVLGVIEGPVVENEVDEVFIRLGKGGSSRS